MQTIKQKITYDSEAIIQQSQIYNDEYGVIKEYIDNSIDSAEEYFDPLTQEYRKQINIEVTKTGGKKSVRKVKIKDNCHGMKVNKRKNYTIFRSSKRNDPRTNGMYGMGQYSGFSICNNIMVETKQRTGNHYRFAYSPKIFKRRNKGPPEIEIIEEKRSSDDFTSGTTITLSSFKDSVFEDLDFRQLKKEIEKHFEQILSRKRIKIVLKEDNGAEVLCESFRYSEYCDTPFCKTLTTLYRTKSKKFKTETTYDISATPIRIFIIAAKNRDLKRELYLAINGRKIDGIAKIEQFRTNKKFQIWSRSNAGGFIDGSGVLETTPTRKDIKKTELSKAFFYTLSKLEPEILAYIESQSAISFSERFSGIEGKVNEILSEYRVSSETPDAENKFKEYTINGYRIRENAAAGSSPVRSNTARPQATATRTPRERSEKVIVKYPTQDGNGARGADTLRFKIDDSNEPYKDENGMLLRSIIRDNTIIVFQKHEEFQKRFYESAKGNYEFNINSIHYIAIEIMTHVKTIETRNQDELGEDVYRDFATEVYRLEEKLKKLNGEKI